MKLGDHFEWKREYNFRLVLGAIAFSLFLYFSMSEFLTPQKKGKSKYIVTSTALNSKVVISQRHRIDLEIVLSDKDTLLVSGARNLFYSNSAIEDFIEVGDSLVKRIGSDTVFVFRGETRHTFVIGKQVRIPVLFLNDNAY